MRIVPAPVVRHLIGVSLLMLTLGIASRNIAVFAWACAIVVAIAVARLTALISISRVRRSGFEMAWVQSQRTQTIGRNTELKLQVELRNRDNRAVRFSHLEPICSTSLAVRVEPCSGEIAAAGVLYVSVVVTGLRVGCHAVHGLSIRVQGAPGLFSVPLLFSNSYGVRVLPSCLVSWLYAPNGGRSRRVWDEGLSSTRRGDGLEFRELREHLPGDSFKHIAWRASAKRGKLIVRDFNRSSRDVVWLVVDASVELWAGKPGEAPLDRGIDNVASLAKYHLQRGDKVGLAVIASKLRDILHPNNGPRHAYDIARFLVQATGTYDADRSELQELQVASRVLEHVRFIDGKGDQANINQIALRAEQSLRHAPFQLPTPQAPTEREQLLRHYLAAFGIESPARNFSERAETLASLAAFIDSLSAHKPSIVHVWAFAPQQLQPQMVTAIKKLQRSGCKLLWTLPDFQLPVDKQDPLLSQAVAKAVSIRANIANQRAKRALARLGIGCVRKKLRRKSITPYQ